MNTSGIYKIRYTGYTLFRGPPGEGLQYVFSPLGFPNGTNVPSQRANVTLQGIKMKTLRISEIKVNHNSRCMVVVVVPLPPPMSGWMAGGATTTMSGWVVVVVAPLCGGGGGAA